MRPRNTVTQWFALIVGGLLAVAVVGIVAGVLSLERLTDRRLELVDRIDPAMTAALQLEAALLDEETGVRGFALAPDPRFLEPYERGRAAEDAALRRLLDLTRAPVLRIVARDLTAVRSRAAEWRRDYAEPTIAAVREGGDAPGEGVGKARFDAVRAALAQQQRDLRATRTEARAALNDAAVFANRLFLAVGLLILIAVVIAAVLLRRVILGPLAALAREARAVARGDFAHAIEPSGPREITALGEDVEAMREQIVAEVAALRDAERALIEQARDLQRSNEELEQFAYVASHDLQEPLRKVASFTQMLQRRYGGQLDERADRYIEFAVDGAKRMQDLINDLLAFSRVGRLTSPHQSVSTAALLVEVRERLGTALEESGAEIVAEDLPTVSGDPGLLTAVFQNLVSNALKFRGEAPPRVVIEAERDGRYWQFTVTDNGIGVEDEYADRIFVIFQRLHTRERYEGTGIGLAMCRKIIEYHGGRIWLAPSEPGRGARFIFTLPADDDSEEETAS